jgi:hypothetical protein
MTDQGFSSLKADIQGMVKGEEKIADKVYKAEQSKAGVKSVRGILRELANNQSQPFKSMGNCSWSLSIESVLLVRQVEESGTRLSESISQNLIRRSPSIPVVLFRHTFQPRSSSWITVCCDAIVISLFSGVFFDNRTTHESGASHCKSRTKHFQ